MQIYPFPIVQGSELTIDGTEVSQLLYYYIKYSAKIGMKLFYDTVDINCTTAIFDGLDILPGVRPKVESGQINPFLTVIGEIPVVRPMVNALLERFPQDLLQQKDLREEMIGQYHSLGESSFIPSSGFPFAPGGADLMNLSILTEGVDRLCQQNYGP